MCCPMANFEQIKSPWPFPDTRIACVSHGFCNPVKDHEKFVKAIEAYLDDAGVIEMNEEWQKLLAESCEGLLSVKSKPSYERSLNELIACGEKS